MAAVPPDRFPFNGPTYLAASPVLDAQRAINLFPEVEYKSSKTPVGLIGRPGQLLFAPTINSPARALWAGNNRLFAVGGTSVYEMNPDGSIMTIYGTISGSPGRGPAQIIANGTQLLLCDPGAPGVYNINPVGPAVTLVFNGVALEYLDGFYVSIATGASLAGANPNQINVSALNDGTTWPGLAYALRTSAADLTTQLATLNGLLWVFGQKTTTVYYNAGSAPFPFARVQGGDINLGLLAPQSVVKFYNCIMWLGGDDRGYAQVYMAQGLNPVRVSNPAIEHYLSTVNPFNVVRFAIAYGYQENGHTFYVLNLTDAFQRPTVTLVYDLTTGLWHERTYSVSGPYPCCSAAIYGFASDPNASPNIVGDGYHGKLYFQSGQYASDDGAAITYVRTSPHVAGDNKLHRYNRFELDGDFGTAAPTLDYSNDGGRNFLGLTTPLKRNQDQIAPSTFQRFYAQQLGVSRDRVFKVTITDDTNLIYIANGLLDVD